MMRERLRAVRRRLNIKQGAFAARLGLSQGHLSDIENGRKDLTDRVIKDICREFGISELWLRAGEGEMMAASEPSSRERLAAEFGLDDLGLLIVEQYAQLNEEGRQAIKRLIKILAEKLPDVEYGQDQALDNVIYQAFANEDEKIVRLKQSIPFSGDVVAGLPNLAFEQNDYIDVVECDESIRADTTLRVSGDSMAPDYQIGDYIYVRLYDQGEHYEKPELNDLVIVSVDGETTFKRLRGMNGKIVLHSFNPEYEDQEYSPEEVELKGKVLGKAELYEDDE